MKKLIILFIAIMTLIASVSAVDYFYNFTNDITGMVQYLPDNVATSCSPISWSAEYGGSMNIDCGDAGPEGIAVANPSILMESGDTLTWYTYIDANNGDGLQFAQDVYFCYGNITPGTNIGHPFLDGCVQITGNADTTWDVYSPTYRWMAKGIDSTEFHWYKMQLNKTSDTAYSYSVEDLNTSVSNSTTITIATNQPRWIAVSHAANGPSGGFNISMGFPPAPIPPCVENWLVQYNNASCNGTFINEIKTYYDNNTCGTYGSLPGDNNSISNTYGCAIPPAPTLKYTAGDIPNIATDTLGEAGVQFKVWVPLLLLGVIIAGLAMTWSAIAGKFR